MSGRKRVPNPPTRIRAFMLVVGSESCSTSGWEWGSGEFGDVWSLLGVSLVGSQSRGGALAFRQGLDGSGVGEKSFWLQRHENTENRQIRESKRRVMRGRGEGRRGKERRAEERRAEERRGEQKRGEGDERMNRKSRRKVGRM